MLTSILCYYSVAY